MPEINLPTKATQDAIKVQTDKIQSVKSDTANILGNFPIKPSKTLKIKVFDAPGTHTWVAPLGVTEVYLTGCGGGGAGGSYSGGTSGGITSFGSLLSLTGGAAGYGKDGGAGAGAGGGGGNGGPNSVSRSFGGAGYSGGNASPIGILNTKGANGARGDGGGGGSASGDNNGGGGAADYKHDFPVTVVPGSSYTISVGLGGKGASGGSGYPGGDGGDGLLIIKWWE